MHRIMVQPLQAGVRLTAIFDSCHSGTALDLPYIYSTQGIMKAPDLAREAGEGLLQVVSSGSLSEAANGFTSLLKRAATGQEAHERTLMTKTSPADVVMFSGSKDNQTSFVDPDFLLLTYVRVIFANVARLVPTKTPVPCRGPSCRPSRRIPNRATSNCSTASATSSPRVIRSVLSSRAAILSVRRLHPYACFNPRPLPLPSSQHMTPGSAVAMVFLILLSYHVELKKKLLCYNEHYL